MSSQAVVSISRNIDLGDQVEHDECGKDNGKGKLEEDTNTISPKEVISNLGRQIDKVVDY